MKNFTLSILLLGLAFIANGQNVPIDFETGGNGADWNWTVFENETNPPLEIVANPSPDGVNGSATVAKFTALMAGNPWAGCETEHGSGIGTFSLTASNSTIKIMVWKSTISDVGIKLVDNTSFSLGEIKIANTVINQWEEISFDFSAHVGITYDQIVVFPDFDPRTSDQIIYFDNISFGDIVVSNEPMIAAPTPTEEPEDVISMFSDAYTNVTVDTWLTGWSNGNLEDIEIAGNPTKKYTNLNFVGIEATAANLIDATEMEFFHFDLWTPNMTTFRVKLVDFGADQAFDGGDDSEHELVYTDPTLDGWISYEIPLTDFTDLGSTTNIAQLIFSGEPAGGGIAYIDNVYFSKTPSIGIEESKGFALTTYPNPTTGNFHLVAASKIDAVIVYSISGQKLISEYPTSNTFNLDVSHLEAGIYMVQTVQNGQMNFERLVKH